MMEMGESKSTNYDDFDMVKLDHEDSSEGLFSPFTFIFFLVLIVLSGFLLLYSSTFDVSVKDGFEHYHYFLNQVIGFIAGLFLGLGLDFLPLRFIKKSYFFLCPLSLVVLVLMLFPSFNDCGIFTISGHNIISGPILGAFSVISLISGAIPAIYKRKEINGVYFVIVALIAIAIAILSALVSSMGYYFLIVSVSIIMLRSTGAKKGFVAICAVFALSTALFLIFVYSPFSSSFFSSILPVANPDFYDHSLFVSQLAIKEGGLTGIGLGKGLYKLGVLSNVESDFIFASISEELGFVGVFFFFVAFLNYFFLGIMAARRAYRKNEYTIASACIALSSIVVVQALISALYCAGIFPFGPVSFPFFSYCPSAEFMFVTSSLILYRYIYLMGRSNEKV